MILDDDFERNVEAELARTAEWNREALEAEIASLRQLLSEAETREREARVKAQAMHRRAQIAEGAFRGVMNVIDLWEPTLRFHKLSTHDIVMRSIKRDFERAVKKSSALQSEER